MCILYGIITDLHVEVKKNSKKEVKNDNLNMKQLYSSLLGILNL